jgi:hypothetical protein
VCLYSIVPCCILYTNSSLFGVFVSDEEKKVYNNETWRSSSFLKTLKGARHSRMSVLKEKVAWLVYGSKQHIIDHQNVRGFAMFFFWILWSKIQINPLDQTKRKIDAQKYKFYESHFSLSVLFEAPFYEVNNQRWSRKVKHNLCLLMGSRGLYNKFLCLQGRHPKDNKGNFCYKTTFIETDFVGLDKY